MVLPKAMIVLAAGLRSHKSYEPRGPQSTGVGPGALRGLGAPSRTTRRRAARPPGGPSRFQAEETPEYVTVHGHGRAQPTRVGAGVHCTCFGYIVA